MTRICKHRVAAIFAIAVVTGITTGCADLDGDGVSTDESALTAQETDPAVVENFDPARAQTIAKAKWASLDGAHGIPQFASCGRAGSTGIQERVNDAAFHGAAKQRSGSSTDCGAPGALQPTDDALYFCFTWDQTFTFSWTYLQNLRTGVRGWTRDDLLRPPPSNPNFGGAANECTNL